MRCIAPRESRRPAFHSRSCSSWIGTLMSAKRDMLTGGPTDAIPLVPYGVTNFLVQEQQNNELGARLSTLFRGFDRDMDPLAGSPLASAWYRAHPEERNKGTLFSDEVGGRHLVCFAPTVLKCRRVRTIIYPRSQYRGAVRERGSPPPGYHQQ